MASFSCPHLEHREDRCLLLKTDCVPGRPGCVLQGTCGFAVPAEERIRLKEEEKLAKRLAALKPTKQP